MVVCGCTVWMVYMTEIPGLSRISLVVARVLSIRCLMEILALVVPCLVILLDPIADPIPLFPMTHVDNPTSCETQNRSVCFCSRHATYTVDVSLLQE